MNLREVLEKQVEQEEVVVDPALLAKAKQYARQAWNFDVLPMLEAFKGSELTEDEAKRMKLTLLEHKYQTLVNSKNKSDDIF